MSTPSENVKENPHVENESKFCDDDDNYRPLSEQKIKDLCEYFDVSSLDTPEVRDMNSTYRKYNKNPPSEKPVIGSKHYYYDLYRIYMENRRPYIRRYVITTAYDFVSVNLDNRALIITYDRVGSKNTAKMSILAEELCIVRHVFSFDMKTLFVDVAYMQNSESSSDTITMTLESMVETKK